MALLLRCALGHFFFKILFEGWHFILQAFYLLMHFIIRFNYFFRHFIVNSYLFWNLIFTFHHYFLFLLLVTHFSMLTLRLCLWNLIIFAVWLIFLILWYVFRKWIISNKMIDKISCWNILRLIDMARMIDITICKMHSNIFRHRCLIKFKWDLWYHLGI